MVIVCRKRRVDKVATMAVKEAVGEEEEEEEDKVEDEKWTLRVGLVNELFPMNRTTGRSIS